MQVVHLTTKDHNYILLFFFSWASRLLSSKASISVLALDLSTSQGFPSSVLLYLPCITNLPLCNRKCHSSCSFVEIKQVTKNICFPMAAQPSTLFASKSSWKLSTRAIFTSSPQHILNTPPYPLLSAALKPSFSRCPMISMLSNPMDTFLDPQQCSK